MDMYMCVVTCVCDRVGGWAVCKCTLVGEGFRIRGRAYVCLHAFILFLRLRARFWPSQNLILLLRQFSYHRPR